MQGHAVDRNLPIATLVQGLAAGKLPNPTLIKLITLVLHFRQDDQVGLTLKKNPSLAGSIDQFTLSYYLLSYNAQHEYEFLSTLPGRIGG